MRTKTTVVSVATIAAFALGGIGTAHADPISETAGQTWNAARTVITTTVCNSPAANATNLICQ